MKFISSSNLKRHYPYLFKKYSGITIFGEGWSKIVKDLCSVILNYIILNDIKDFSFIKIEKRFGVLFIQSINGDDFINQTIRLAERLSYRTCENCGNRGNLYSSSGNSFGKYATLCDKDALKILYKKV